MSAREAIARVLDFATQNGWEWVKTAGGHYRFTKVGCQPVFASSTPSDHRMTKNAIGLLKRESPAVHPQPTQT